MNTTENETLQIESRFNKEKIINILKRIGQTLLVGLLIFAAVTYFTKINEKNYPGNHYCVNSLKISADQQEAFSKQMANALRGDDVTVIDLTPVKVASQECNKHKGEVNLKVETK